MRYLSLIFLLALSLLADIDIKRDEQGRIAISNRSPIMAAQRSKTMTQGQTVQNPYHQLILTICSVHGVDPQLASAVCRAESAFNPRAVSKKGAVGLMQLMSDTAKDYGVRDRTDPLQNLTGGIRHLKHLQQKYPSLPLTLAAYNAGEETVRQYNGIPPFPETRNYITRVMGLMGLTYTGMQSGKSRVYMYQQTNGRILLTDTPMPVDKGYKILQKQQ